MHLGAEFFLEGFFLSEKKMKRKQMGEKNQGDFMNGNEALEGSLMFLNLVHIPPKNIGCVPLKQENSRRLFGVFPMSA